MSTTPPGVCRRSTSLVRRRRAHWWPVCSPGSRPLLLVTSTYRRSGRQDPADFVLQSFPSSQSDDVAVEVSRAADAIECLVTQGLDATQQRYNS